MQSILRETIVIIPRLHFVYHHLDITCCRNASHFFVISKHISHFLLREAQHLIKLRLGRDMPANIESTRHIVQGYRTDTCDEDTLKHTLELLEDITVEAVGMGDCPIYILTLLIEHGIGEIVIFIDDQIERNALGCSLILKQSQFLRTRIRLKEPLLKICQIKLLVNSHEAVQFNTQIHIEVFLQLFDTTTHIREIKVKNLILPL